MMPQAPTVALNALWQRKKIGASAALDKAPSILLDYIGAIPFIGNTVSVLVGIGEGAEDLAHVVDLTAAFGGAGAGLALGGVTDNDPVGGLSASAGIGLAAADVTLGGTKALPIAGNIVSGLTFLYDVGDAGKKYGECMEPFGGH